MILIAASELGAGSACSLNAEQLTAANVNGDTAVDAVDAALVLTYASDSGAGKFTGTPEEYFRQYTG